MRTVSEVNQTRRQHQEGVSPGQPFRLTGAHAVGEGVWQGDLGIGIVDRVPEGYVEVKTPKDEHRQLVPEGGQGSHHRIASLDGVRIFLPPAWGENSADLRGPVVVFSGPNSIVHEPGTDKHHGTVVIEAPMTVQCTYQRNLDQEEREMRAVD